MSKQQPDYDPANPQSKKKLDVYSSYLSAYLNIILNTPIAKEIHIYDMLAGKGKYEKSESTGSAIRALEVIKRLSPNLHNKEIYLHLNEYKSKSYNALLRNIAPKPDWVDCTNEDVNDAIQLCLANDFLGKYKVFYLDPYGYTQIKRASIDTIMARQNVECLLFVPVSRIVQFVKRGKPMEEQEKGIAKFLEEYKIDIKETYIQKIKWNNWGMFIKDKLAEIYSKQYIGMATLQAGKANNYALYFIGNHIYGLHKFVEIVSKIEKGEDVQSPLISEEGEKLCKYLSEKRTNIELYDWGLRHGWLPSRIRKVLIELEKKERLIVYTPDKRKLGDFYLGYGNYKKPKPILHVKIKSERK